MKSILTSKTFLLAVVQAIAGIIVVFVMAYPEVGWLMAIKSVVDIILRMLTTQPVTATLPGR